jgi:hypothetical protein
MLHLVSLPFILPLPFSLFITIAVAIIRNVGAPPLRPAAPCIRRLLHSLLYLN